MNDVKSVLYNDGENDDVFALVAADRGDHLLDLIVFLPGGAYRREDAVPRRAKADYGPEGGGRTWHD